MGQGSRQLPKRVCLNKPIAMGAAVLDLSKLHMHKMWLDCIVPAFDKTELIFTDTDSLCFRYEGQWDPLARDTVLTREMDFSNYPPPYKNDVRKMLLGYLKDEAVGARVTHGYLDTYGYLYISGIENTWIHGYLCIAHTQYCTYRH